FSSRRRHTRSKRDWSSDVCSSDLLRHLLTEVESMYRRAKELKFSKEYINGELMSDIKQLFPLSMQRNINKQRRDRAITLRDLLRSEERRVGKEGTAGGAQPEASEK